MSVEYGWKFELDGVDITDKVKSFTITWDIEGYCRELSFELTDETLYDTFNFSVIPETPRVEVFTRITDDADEYDEYDYAWISQGTFFIERPTFKVGIHETLTGVWGRQSTAVLGEPFAQKVTKIWDSNTTFYVICQEILESVGLTWDPTLCDIQDFSIYSDNFQADDEYPIQTLQNLVELIVGKEGFVTSDRLGNVVIKRVDRTPTVEDYNLTDSVVQSINEEPTWPEFGNRIKIIPSESVSQDTIDLHVDNECISTGAYIDIYAQVKDGEGVPINDAVVTWSFDPTVPLGVWFVQPSFSKTVTQNSSRILVSNELKRADGFNKIVLDFEPDDILGIWAYADKTRSTNFAPAGGYVIDGKNVYLTSETFTYCDQMVFISYYANGMVRNSIYYGTDQAEPEEAVYTFREVTVIASVSGRESSQLIYVDNSCKCKSTLSVKVDPTSIVIGQSTAKIEAYLENSGVPVSGTIRMTEVSGFGALQWTSRTTGLLETSETTEAVNSIAGQTQCVVSSAIESVSGVYLVDSEGVKTGSNLYSSFYGRNINLTTYVLTGTSLIVEYSRSGSVVNYLTGIAEGVSRIDVSADVSTEEGLVQSVQVTVQTAGGGGGGGGGTTPPAGLTYTITGPTLLTKTGLLDQAYGPYTMRASDGSTLTSVQFSLSGSGYLRMGNSDTSYNPQGKYIVMGWSVPSGNITLTGSAIHLGSVVTTTLTILVVSNGGNPFQ